MTDAEPEAVQQEGISRRDVMKRGAVVGGAMVWATPVVQAVAGPAFADAGTPAEGGISFVAVLFTLNGTRYRFKIEDIPEECDAHTSGDVNCGHDSVECGPTFKVTQCDNDLDRGGENIASPLPNGVDVTTCNGDTVVIDLPEGSAEIQAVVKGGGCCEDQESDFVTVDGTTITFADCGS